MSTSRVELSMSISHCSIRLRAALLSHWVTRVVGWWGGGVVGREWGGGWWGGGWWGGGAVGWWCGGLLGGAEAFEGPSERRWVTSKPTNLGHEGVDHEDDKVDVARVRGLLAE